MSTCCLCDIFSTHFSDLRHLSPHLAGLKTGMLKAKQALRQSVDQNRQGIRGEESLNSTGGSRPGTAQSRKSVGSWVSQAFNSPGAPSPSPGLASRIRPQSAIGHGGAPRANFGGKRNKPYGSASWRSVSRSDFRPPSAGVMPPRLNLPRR